MKFFIVVALLAGVVLGDDANDQHTLDAPGEKQYVKQQIPTLPHKAKRSTPTCGVPTKLTQNQQTETVAQHNLCRSQEGATDMLSLVWDDEMAYVAQAYANQCIWAHGGLKDCENNDVGQNLYVIANPAATPALNMTNVIWSWNSERASWNFGTSTCQPGQMCGHWTQNVAARSYKVGCGWASCPTISVSGQTWNNALLVVCDYSPPGNIIGNPIYEPGPACSHCDYEGTGSGYKCSNSLCVKCTPASDPACACGTPQQCQNGASWDPTTCSCNCGTKYWGVQCQNACTCADQMDCSSYAGTTYCTDPSYSVFMATNCVTTCKLACFLPSNCVVSS